MSPYGLMAWRRRPLTRAEFRLVSGLAILIWCACAPPPPPPRIAPRSFSGTWIGTTSQGRSIAFTVSRDQRITTVKFDYAFGGCLGSLTIPAGAPLLNTPGRAAATVTFPPDGQPGSFLVVVRFLFLSSGNANGTIEFTNDPVCGSGSATWTAAR